MGGHIAIARLRRQSGMSWMASESGRTCGCGGNRTLRIAHASTLVGDVCARSRSCVLSENAWLNVRPVCADSHILAAQTQGDVRRCAPEDAGNDGGVGEDVVEGAANHGIC